MPDPKKKPAAPADATRVKPARTPAAIREDLDKDQGERDRFAALAEKPDSIAGRPAPVPDQNKPYRLSKSAEAQDRMNARADSIAKTNRLGKKVKQELFDVDEDVDAMKKTAANDLHRSRTNGGR